MTQLISDADMEMLQSIAFIINLIEWGYGRLDADGIESSFGKVITFNELLDIEKIFSDKTKSLLETNSLFDFSKWGRVFCLLESFEPNFTKSYLQTAFVNDENVLQFIDRFVDIYTGHNKLYEVKENYTAYFSAERAIESIEACRQNATFFMLSGELQQKCAAFFLTVACNERRRGKIPQEEVEKLIADWERHE